MTTRILKTSTRTTKKLVVSVLCPSCRGIVRAQHIGHAVINGQRKEVVMCLSQPCGLTWVPERGHLVTAA